MRNNKAQKEVKTEKKVKKKFNNIIDTGMKKVCEKNENNAYR